MINRWKMKHKYKVMIAYLIWFTLSALLGYVLGFLRVPNLIVLILAVPFAMITSDLPKYIIKRIK
jgi:hypothetical protein